MAMNRLTVLDLTIRAAGIPIDGVSAAGSPPSAANVTVQYRPEATVEQIAAGNAIRDGFDYRPRRDLSPAAIASQVAALTVAQEVALRRRVLARVLLQFQQDAQEVIAALNLPLAVDEVVP